MKKISAQRVRVFDYVARGGWVSAAQIAKGAKVAPRTARGLATSFTQEKVFESTSALFPGTLYRMAANQSPEITKRLDEAREILAQVSPRRKR